jgi:hypothetical protein
MNRDHLDKLPGPIVTFKAIDKSYRAHDEISPEFMAPDNLELKVGAQVMLLKNLHSDLVNGSVGIVTHFNDEADPNSDLHGMPSVQFTAVGGEIINHVLARENFDFEHNGTLFHRRKQVSPKTAVISNVLLITLD